MKSITISCSSVLYIPYPTAVDASSLIDYYVFHDDSEDTTMKLSLLAAHCSCSDTDRHLCHTHCVHCVCYTVTICCSHCKYLCSLNSFQENQTRYLFYSMFPTELLDK